jgi:ureidoglycolate lyase
VRTIKAQPLTKADFAPFGEVIETDGARHFAINSGNCERYHDLAQLDVRGENGRQIVSIFAASLYALPLKLSMVERHPLGSQAFIPLDQRPFLVIVAPDENGVPGTPLAFMTAPGQGVNYAANIWHGVVTPVGAAQRFVVIDRAGDGNNLEEHFYSEPFRIEA